MATKKITVNELKSLVKQIMTESKSITKNTKSLKESKTSTTKKVTSNGLKSLVKQIIKEERIREDIFNVPEDEFTVDYEVPEWALSALINDDYSGLKDEDILKVKKFRKEVYDDYGSDNFFIVDIDGYSDLGFKKYNDIDSLGSNVYLVQVRPSDEHIKDLYQR
jgi:hypothetical protein